MKLVPTALLLCWAVSGLTSGCTMEPLLRPTARKTLVPTHSVIGSRVVDTTIFIRNVGPLLPQSAGQLTPVGAQRLVEKYYQRKGYRLCGTESFAADTTGLASCVAFDTSRIVELNHDGRADALVSYWLMPCGSSGTCFWPTKALLISEVAGYRLIGEQFIADEFSIDTIRSGADGRPVIAVGDWDCSEHRLRRQLNVRLLLR